MCLSGSLSLLSLIFSMKLYPQQLCQLAFLSFCCALITVRESAATFVPARCLCPQTQLGVRGQLKEVSILHKNPTCQNVTIIVTLKKNNQLVCLNPEAPMGKQLVRCWNRAKKLGRDVKLCLRRRRMRGGRHHRRRMRTSKRNSKSSQ